MRLNLKSRKAASTASRIGNSFHAAVDQLAAASGPAVDRAAAAAHEVVDSALGRADAAAGWLGAHADSVQKAQRRLVARSTKYVMAHPLKTAAVFFVAGVIFARLMR